MICWRVSLIVVRRTPFGRYNRTWPFSDPMSTIEPNQKRNDRRDSPGTHVWVRWIAENGCRVYYTMNGPQNSTPISGRFFFSGFDDHSEPCMKKNIAIVLLS